MNRVSWNAPFSKKEGATLKDHEKDILTLLKTYEHIAEGEKIGLQKHHNLFYDDDHHPMVVYRFMEENYPLHKELGLMFQYRHSLPYYLIITEIKRIKPSNNELYEFKQNIHRRIEHINWLNILEQMKLRKVFHHVSVDELNKHIYDSIMNKEDLIQKLPVEDIIKDMSEKTDPVKKAQPAKKKPEPAKKKVETTGNKTQRDTNRHSQANRTIKVKK
jgi:hypothetical protein